MILRCIEVVDYPLNRGGLQWSMLLLILKSLVVTAKSTTYLVLPTSMKVAKPIH
jgi:hypothetical protein